MADDINPALRAELLAALAVIQPQLRGMRVLAAVGVSSDLMSLLNSEIAERQNRATLVQNVLNELDATVSALGLLEADGYPVLYNVLTSPSLLAELQMEEADIASATQLFQVAETGSFNPSSASIVDPTTVVAVEP